jgi:Protein of unknown function (DUF3179)
MATRSRFRSLPRTEAGVVELEVSGRPVVVWSVAGLRSALDTSRIAEGRPVAATGAFDPPSSTVAACTSPRRRIQFIDAETRSSWTILGKAIRLTGTQLTPVDHVDTFWFAWAGSGCYPLVPRPRGTHDRAPVVLLGGQGRGE